MRYKKNRRRTVPVRNRNKRKGSKKDPYLLRLPRDFPWKVAQALIEDLSQFASPDTLKEYQAAIRARDVDKVMAIASEWNLQCIFRSGEPATLNDVVKLQLGALLKKYPFEGNRQGRIDSALDAVRQGEASCSQFNRKGYKGLYQSDGQLSPIFAEAKRFVVRVLGELDFELVQNWCRHGPGASTATSKGNQCAYFKYSQWPYHVTAAARGHAERLIRSDERWIAALEESYRRRYQLESWRLLRWDTFFEKVLETVPGNRITTVPKDYHKDRPIAIEPTLNVMLQLGVDGHIRRRLKRWGIDLDNQFRNMRLAREGSSRSDMWSPATIDLSNASDTVSLRIAKILLPPEWYEYVVAIRSPQGTLPSGKRLRYSKLSSMGNGSTFAIESLIFASIAYGVCKQVLGHWPRDFIAVYGDDIIVPKVVAPYVVCYLEEAGFSINQDKTFLEGPVKESCGTDWIHGRNVRPVYLDATPTDVTELFALRNLLTRWACQHIYGCEAGNVLPALTSLIRRWVPNKLLLYGPPSDTEVGTYLHWSNDEAPYQGSLYRFAALEKRCIPQKGEEFLFRKLQAPLRVVLGPRYEDYRKVKPTASGAFDVTSKGRWRFSVNKRRVASEWPSVYCSPDTVPLRECGAGPSRSTDLKG